MTKALENILLDHGIQNRELTQAINNLISKGIRASKEFGKRCVVLSPKREEQAYDNFLEFVKEYIESDGSVFALQNLMDFNNKYGLYERTPSKTHAPTLKI